jgi:tetratricopeptide (TPR) repeat protein
VLLRRLSVFTGWSLEMAERVCADDGLPAARVAGLLAALADAALIAPEPTAAGRARYSMPGAVRDYAAGRLAQAGEADVLRRRLRDYIAPLADYVATIGTAQVPATWMVLPEVFRSYDADAANFRAVLAWCLEHGDAETGLRICTALRLCWLVRGARVEGISWLDALRDAGGAAVPPSVLGPALAVRAQLALDGGDLGGAAAWGSASLELSRAAGDSRFSATALDVLARVALRAGQPQDALRYAGEALELTHAPSERWTRGFALGSRSTALAALGRLAESAEWAQAGLALMQELDNQWGAALFRLGLGDVARAVGDLHPARGHYLAALPFVRESMGAPETARCLAHLGRMALRQGDPGPAREYLAESLRLSLACGSRAGIVRALRGFAALALREGRTGRAVKLAGAITALCEAAGLRPPRPERIQRYLDAAADLGADEVSRLWAAGLELTSRTAADLALEPPALSAAGRSGA